MAKNSHLLMVSFDAVGDQNIDRLLGMPNFSSLCARGTLVRKVSSVLVSNTYPTHTTIQTGVLPRTHGVFDNEIKAPQFKSEQWRYHVKNIRVRTLPDEATKAGKTVCSVLFPVTGGANIRYNFPEMAGHINPVTRGWRTVRYGSTGFVMGSLLRRGRLLKKFETIDLDCFTTAVTCDTIRKREPDLVMIHLLDVDTAKHVYGPDSPEADAALKRLDGHLGDLLRAVADTSAADDYSVLVFSDHSCCPIENTIEPNYLLKEAGISLYDAFFHCSCGTSFLRLYNPERKAEVLAFAEEFLKNPGVDRLLTDEEMYVSGADLEFIRGFSAAPGYSFGEGQKGQHGYTLDRADYNTFYLAAGGKVPVREVRSGGSLLNICPLAVDLLDLEPWPMEQTNLLFTRS